MRRLTRTGTLAAIAGALTSGPATADEPSWTEGVSRQAGVNGRVHAIVEGEGVVYLGGRFDSAGGRPALNVAGFDGVEWQALGELPVGPEGRVLTLLHKEGLLFAGGEFLFEQGVNSSRVARWDGVEWQPVGSLAIGEAVTALTFHDDGSGSALYAAVRHDLPSYEHEAQVVRLSPFGLWEPVGGTPQDPIIFNGELSVLMPARDGGLYAAGEFGEVGELQINSLAAWNGADWEPVGGEGLWSEYIDDDGQLVPTPGWVSALVYARFAGGEDQLYVLGEFENADDLSVQNIAVWDGDSWQVPPSLPEVKRYEGATSWDGDLLAAVSYYDHLDDPALNLVMRLDDGQQWVPESDDPYSGDGFGVALCKTQIAGAERLFYVGEWRIGFYEYYQGVQQWTHGRWFGLGGDAASLHRYAHADALAVYGEGTERSLYIGGGLQRSDGLHPFRGVLRWDGQSYSYLQNADAQNVNDMIVHDDGMGERLFVAVFDSIETPGGFMARRVAAWDGSQWHSIGDPGGGPFGAQDLEVFDAGAGEDLYVGGDALFRAWDGNEWYFPGFGVNGSVWSMTVGELNGAPVLFAGGEFTRAGYVFTHNIAAWDGQQWHEVGGGLPDAVKELGWYEGTLYAAGEFGTDAVLVWDGSNWSSLGLLRDDDVVHRFRVLDDKLYVVGDLAFGDVTWGVAVFDGDAWIGVDGCPNDVYDVAFYDDGTAEPALYLGGDFTEAGGVTSWKIARYGYPLPPRQPADFNNDGGVNQSDLGLLLAAYGTEPGQPFFDVRTDLNRDFLVNQPDLAELLGVYERGR